MNALPRDQQRLASQRVAGVGRLAVEATGGRTRLWELYQEGAAKIRVPTDDGTGQQAVLINTAGGVTGGDRVDWTIEVGPGAALTTTTQASEKVYRSAYGEARIASTIEVGARGRLSWLPQETILYQGAALSRELSVALSPGAEALLAEAVVLGRKAHGETVTRARFRDRWRISANGRLVHADDIALGPDVAAITAAAAGLAGRTAFATVLLVSEEAEALLEAARGVIGEDGGASFWRVGGHGKLLARLVAADGHSLRARLGPLLRLLNRGAALPKLWST